ncbi:hypothetical protein ACS0TY_035185 [Phlomoides rotata]
MTASSNSVTSELLKRKSNDVGWEYVVLTNPSNLDRVRCILCEKGISGGIYRLKQHFAGVRENVSTCTKSSKDDQLKCSKALEEASRKKRGKKEKEEQMRSQVDIDDDIIDLDLGGEGLEGSSLKESMGSKSQGPIGPMDKFVNQINPEANLNLGKNMRDRNIKEAIYKERLDKVKEYVCRWAYEASIHFNAFELDSCKMIFKARSLEKTL